MVGQANSAVIGILDDHLYGQITDGVSTDTLYVANFFTNNKNKVFGVSIGKNTIGDFKLVVNGGYIISSSGGATYGIANEYLSMGCGRDDSFNIEATIYEAHVFNGLLTDSASAELFYGGSNFGDIQLIASYIPNNLTQSPGQWLDSKGNHHILLSTTGSNSTNPKKDFSLRFYATASSYLGDGYPRDVLPENYVLTSCVVESDYKPLLAIGSTSTPSVTGSSGTGSWYDNRVPFTSASYGVNDMGLLALGVAHPDRTLYVAFSGSEYPCTFSFEGYIRL
jgi:hypothetical protein